VQDSLVGSAQQVRDHTVPNVSLKLATVRQHWKPLASGAERGAWAASVGARPVHGSKCLCLGEATSPRPDAGHDDRMATLAWSRTAFRLRANPIKERARLLASCRAVNKSEFYEGSERRRASYLPATTSGSGSKDLAVLLVEARGRLWFTIELTVPDVCVCSFAAPLDPSDANRFTRIF
jgi:hypothetical protein